MATATLLLPEAGRLAGDALAEEVGRALGRADRGLREPGETAQLARHFQLVPEHWPVAALTRQLDAGDALGASWLRADPAYVVPDMQGARLMACGETLALDEDDTAALLPALQPMFGDAGVLLDAPVPSRWYLRLAPEAVLPTFAPPDEALGEDLFEHLPSGEGERRWRALLTEAQVVLHQHPWNRARAARGKRAINSLWFWGGGVYPHAVSSAHAQVRSRDSLLLALAKASGVAEQSDRPVDALIDLRQLRSLAQFSTEVVAPLLASLRRGELERVVLDFQDGVQFALEPRQRWRFWRKSQVRLAG